MSNPLLTQVLTESPLHAERRLVLIVLADCADKQTNEIKYSLKKIALRANITEKAAYEIMADFIRSGLVERLKEGRGRGIPSIYRIRAEHISRPIALKPPSRKGVLEATKPPLEMGVLSDAASGKPPLRATENPPCEGVKTPLEDGIPSYIDPLLDPLLSHSFSPAPVAAAPPEAEARKKASRPRTGRKTKIRGDFVITRDLAEWGAVNAPHVDLIAATEDFVDYHLARGTFACDWAAMWRGWIRIAERKANELERRSNRLSQGSQAVRHLQELYTDAARATSGNRRADSESSSLYRLSLVSGG